MSAFNLESLPLKGLKRLIRQPLVDDRGFFSRIFCAEELAHAGWHAPIAQINHSYTRSRGIVRGLHFQRTPYREMKLVSVLRGEIWDVVVDLRCDSETYLQWHAELLSAQNGCAVLIPGGFAHGFQSMSDDAELIYCHSCAYKPQAEGGLNPLDETLAIDWPLAITGMSLRDQNHPRIDSGFTGIPSQ